MGCENCQFKYINTIINYEKKITIWLLSRMDRSYILGGIIGIVITYIVNKPTNSHSSSIKRDNIEERLIKLKTLLDQGILNKEEFEQQKKKILEE